MKKSDHEKSYYEDNFNWQRFVTNHWLEKKIEIIKSIIPHNVISILDVGCGNGIITKPLMLDYRVFGIDRSLSALKYVEFERIRGDITILPIKSYAVDMTICSEVLEHLEGKFLMQAIEELKRVSKQYILVTVPNNENLNKNSVKCPACQFKFNASFHYNFFNETILDQYFNEYKKLYTFESGKPVRQYNNFLLWIRQNIGNSWGRFRNKRRVICPRCGKNFIPILNNNIISFVCDGLNRFLSSLRPYWLGILYEKV
jgi:SAM-dependent methyltransferase